jgi:hypothetical protein
VHVTFHDPKTTNILEMPILEKKKKKKIYILIYIYIGIQKHSYSNIKREFTEQFPERDNMECKYSDETCYEYERKGFHTSDRDSVLQHLVLW